MEKTKEGTGMSVGLVVYQSKYGATKKYAEMLREESGCDVCGSGSCSGAKLGQYPWVVFAGGIYASGISGLDVLKKNYGRLKTQKVAVFCVGASPLEEKALEEIKNHNLKGELAEIPLFYGRGIWDEDKMGFKDRTLCRLLQKAIAKKDPGSLEPWMKALLSAAGQRCDWTDRKYLIPLMEYLGVKK